MIRWAIAIAVVFSTITAYAERGAVLPPQLKPAGAPEVQNRFHEAIVRGLSAPDLEVLPAAEMRLRLFSEEMWSCAGGSCAGKVASTLHVGWFVAPEIQVMGKDYIFRLRLIDPSGRVDATVEETCEICTVKEADEAAARAAAKLGHAARKMVVASPPKPAPKTTPAAPPPPAAAPQPEPIVSPPPTSTASKGRPYLWAGVGMVVVGVVGLAAGIPLIVIDGEPTCDPPKGMSAKTTCKEVYDTLGGGGVLTALGVAAFATSGAMFYLDHRSRKPKTISIAPTRGGAMLVTGGTF